MRDGGKKDGYLLTNCVSKKVLDVKIILGLFSKIIIIVLRVIFVKFGFRRNATILKDKILLNI